MSDRLFTLSRGPHQRAKAWERHALTLPEVFQLFEIHVSRAEKDGPAIVAGAIVGGERKGVAVERLSFLIFDVDGTQSIDKVRELTKATGKYALLYTTYSHLKTVEWVKTDSYSKWAARKHQPPKHTPESVLAYLKDNDKGYLTNVVVTEQPQHTAEGVAIKVTHDPVHKIRVVFPLARDFVMADSGGYTSADHIQEWKRIYAGVATAIGYDFDKACMDPARLHFLPAHKEGAPYAFEHFDGPLLDYADYQKAPVEKIGSSASAIAIGPDGGLASYGESGASFNGKDMNEWVSKQSHGTGHRLIELIAHHDPNPHDPRIRGDRGSDKDGVHIQCPFEDEHSTTGGLGTFINPGPEGNYDKVPTIRCMHAHCAGRKTEDFLVKMMVDGWIKFTDLFHMTKTANLLRSDSRTLHRLAIDEYERASTISEIDLIKKNEDQTPEQTLVVEQLSGYIKDGLKLPEEFIVELAGVRYLDSFDRVFGNAVGASQVIDSPATRIYALGLSPIGVPSLRLYYRQHAAQLLIRYADYITLIGELREKARPVAAAVDELVMKRLVNQERRDAIKAIADYYGMTVRDITLTVREAESQSGSITQQELEQRTNALFGHYVVYSDKTQLWFLDPATVDADGQRQNRIFSKGVLAQRYANMFYEYQTDQGRKRIDLFEWWIKNRRDVQYLDEVAFRPDRPTNDAPNANPMLYNLYEGMHAVKAVPGDATPFYDHILKAWCANDEVKAKWIITWFADIVQNPGNRPASALVIHGGQGTGKSIIFDHCLSKVLAPYAVTSNRREDITGRFNTVLKTTLLFVAEESVFAGDPQAAAKIKSYVSSDTFTLEAKGQDTSTAKMFARFAFLTNDFHAMRMDNDDRRYCVIETSDEYKQKTEYFQKLRTWFEDGGNEIVFHYLKTWRPEEHGLAWTSLYTAPNDDDKSRQKRLSLGPIAVLIRDLLGAGNIMTRNNSEVFPTAWEMDSEFTIPASTYRQACMVMCESFSTRMFQMRVELEERLALCAGFPDTSRIPRRRASLPGGRVDMCLVFPPRRITIQRATQLGLFSRAECESMTGEAMPEIDLTSHLRGALAKHAARARASTTIEEASDETAA